MKNQRRHLRVWIIPVVFAVPLLLAWAGMGYVAVRTTSALPQSVDERRTTAEAHLWGLRHMVRDENAAQSMQKVFPEGGCFTVTLYGLAWTNLAAHFDIDQDMRNAAIREAMWAIEQYDEPHVAGPFTTTQVRNGVFWLGQRNLVIGQLLAIMPQATRPPALVQEFHDNSRSLAQAFLASPTAHLDSYPQLCWPADNVTALASLLIHDDIYATEYRAAFNYWKTWTKAHADPLTGLPAGHLVSMTGQLLQPARGCANSWMLALISQMEPTAARDMYELYQRHFLISRLGISVFREYPKDMSLGADIDSGPIILEAGVTATGVGLAAALSNGDLQTAEDIYGLAATLGLKGNEKHADHRGTRYLFGGLPVGDAFLTWAHTLPVPNSRLSTTRSFGGRLWARKPIIIIFLTYSIIVVFVFRWLARRARSVR